MISSPSPNEGKSLTATNLAVATAQAGQQVVLVDADLHRPKQHRLLGLRNNLGLTTALLEDNPDLNGLLQQTSVPGLRLLTTGPLPPNPSELLGSRRMRALEEALGAQADLVIYDTPPVMALADAATLGSRLDGVLMVISAGETRREMARRAMLALQHVNAHVVGALLNRMPSEPSGYYYYYYQYGYREVGEDDGRDGTSSGRRGRFGGLFRRCHRGRRTVPPVEGRQTG
jgi:capsular exopolysaccharide synthesis family protein